MTQMALCLPAKQRGDLWLPYGCRTLFRPQPLSPAQPQSSQDLKRFRFRSALICIVCTGATKRMGERSLQVTERCYSEASLEPFRSSPLPGGYFNPDTAYTPRTQFPFAGDHDVDPRPLSTV